jgi:hypothetical protein
LSTDGDDTLQKLEDWQFVASDRQLASFVELNGQFATDLGLETLLAPHAASVA